MNRTLSVRIRSHIAQAFSCVLLVGIVYSATFNAVHSHGITSTGLTQNISHNITGQFGVVSEVPVRSRTDGQECLICVLHRQFSNSVHLPFLIVGPSTLTAVISAAPVFHHSISFLFSPIARHSGRAPPFCQA